MAPRYTYLSPGTQSFEFHIVADRRTNATCFVVIAANDFKTALKRALEWSASYSAARDGSYYPRVDYRGSRVLVKRIDNGNAYIENNGKVNKWVPVEVLAK